MVEVTANLIPGRSGYPAAADEGAQLRHPITVQESFRDSIPNAKPLLFRADYIPCKQVREERRLPAALRTTSQKRGQYVDLKNREIHSNTVEGYFSIFKRGKNGVFGHCGEQHPHRYLAEFEFRYNHCVALSFNDPDRSRVALHGNVGKRLTYQTANRRA